MTDDHRQKSCTKFYDFISGVTVSLSLSPSDEAERPGWDIVRPNSAAEELLRKHQQVLSQQANKAE